LYRFLEKLGRIRIPVRLGSARFAGDPEASDARGGRFWTAYARTENLFQVWGPLEGSAWEPYHAVPLFAAVDWMDRKRLGPTPLRIVEEDAARLAAARGGSAAETSIASGARDAELAAPAEPAAATAESGANTAESGAAPKRQQREEPPFLLPAHARPGSPSPDWLEPGTMCVLDLPDRATVEAAAWLVTAAGAQPVCTFDHWPHEDALLPADRIIAELLRWATTLAAARGRIAADSPPLWICDSTRLGTRKGEAGEFDNRYYLDDSILPAPEVLRREGVQRLVYLSWAGGEDSPDSPAAGSTMPVADLVDWFAELLAAGIEVRHSPVSDPALRLRPFQARLPRGGFSTSGFRRSAAGGFGTEVPEPSSSGGSG